MRHGRKELFETGGHLIMKLKLTPQCVWHKWFAWHPVRIQGDELVWLEYVQRWHSSTAQCPWQYKEFRENSGVTTYEEDRHP